MGGAAMTAVVNKEGPFGTTRAGRMELRISNSECSPPCDVASEEIELPTGVVVKLVVSPAGKKPQRRVVASCGDVSHRDRIDLDSSISRDRFVKRVAAKLGADVETVAPLIDRKLTELADKAGHLTENSVEQESGERESQATIAADMAVGWDLGHTPGSVAYATVPAGSHNETWPIKSQMFKRYLAKQFYDKYEKVINSEALSASINLMEAKSLFEGEEHEVHVRVADHDGTIYVDLCNENWQVVEITPSGWNVIDKSPVRFRRSRGMLPLPQPERGGSVEQLRGFLNVDNASWHLIVAWLVSALRPRGPYPLLALFAEQGAGKSTAGRLLRSLVDPNSAPLRTEHRNARDLMIGANNSWCLAYDNLSYVPQWLSDALCRLSTGGGFATRELYTDLDEIIFDSQRPVLLTSIEEVATRSDLLDRCLIVWLPAIPEDQRRREEEIEQAFEAVRPRILGALFDAISGALGELPGTKLSSLPRMADFALWVTASEKALGWPSGTFIDVYQGNRDSANELALESSPVGTLLLELLGNQGEWSGSASELLDVLDGQVPDQTKRAKSWPKNGRSMAGHLKRLSPNLRAVGWEVEYHREASRRTWTIRPMTQPTSPTVTQTTTTASATGMQTDANQCDSLSDDENDTRDATSHIAGLARERNSDEWEEGEL